MFELTDALIQELTSIDTPTVCNALEVLVPARRGWGYTSDPLVCTRPEIRMVGIARTATIRSAHPSDLGGAEARRLNRGIVRRCLWQRGCGAAPHGRNQPEHGSTVDRLCVPGCAIGYSGHPAGATDLSL